MVLQQLCSGFAAVFQRFCSGVLTATSSPPASNSEELTASSVTCLAGFLRHYKLPKRFVTMWVVCSFKPYFLVGQFSSSINFSSCFISCFSSSISSHLLFLILPFLVYITFFLSSWDLLLHVLVLSPTHPYLISSFYLFLFFLAKINCSIRGDNKN